MRLKKSVAAFTLIDTLFALMLTLLIFSFFCYFIRYTRLVHSSLYTDRDQEWEIFLLFLEKNTQNCQNYRIENNVFKCEATSVDYEKGIRTVELKKGSKNWIYLSINGGTNIVLTKVVAIAYQLNENSLVVTVKYLNGEVRSDQIKLAKL